MEFYEEYPLFNGELLDSFPLLEESSVFEGLEPGHKSVITIKCQPSKDSYGNLVQDDRQTEQVQDINVPWMDKRIDLVDFLMSETDTSDINYVSLLNTPHIKPASAVQQMALLNMQLPVDDQQVLSMMDASYVGAEDDHVTTSTNDASYTSTDSGVELSLDESTSSLFELLPPQLVQNLEATSALSLLMDGGAEAHLANMTTDLLSMSPEDVEKVLSIPSSPVSDGDMPLLISPTTYTSPSSTTTIDLADLFLNVPSPARSISPSLSSGYNVPSPAPSISPSLSSGYSGRSSPYARIDEYDLKTVDPVIKCGSGRTVVEKKRRKMQQNKDAAIRYRQKKKTEGKVIDGECNILEHRNNELRDQIDSMSREIAYLKELMTDVATAKKSIKASKLK